MTSDQLRGVIVLGHGSRRPEGCEAAQATAERLRERHPAWLVQAAFFEFSTPGFMDVVDDMARSGVSELIVTPLFLSMGMHVCRNLPDLIEQIKAQYPTLKVVLAGHIGADPLLCDIVEARIQALD